MIIFLQGPPCSGKSTLAKKISSDLDFLHISKDDLLETFFDSVEENPPKWLGGFCNNLLVKIVSKIASNDINLLIESNFNKGDLLKKLDPLLHDETINVLEVFLTASEDILLDRFKLRASSDQRHSGHEDEKRYNDLKTYLSLKPQAVSIFKNVITIDSEGLNPESVYKQVLNEIKKINRSTQ